MDCVKSGIMGQIVGDALGLPVQFRPRENRDLDPVTDMRGYGAFDMPPGSWSDDSSLILATIYGFHPWWHLLCHRQSRMEWTLPH